MCRRLTRRSIRSCVEPCGRLGPTGLLLGSPDYLAPERIDGRTPATAIDLWGLRAAGGYQATTPWWLGWSEPS